MKNITAKAVTALALLAGSAATLSAQDTRVPPASAFAPIERYAIAYEEPREMGKFYIRDFGLNARDADFEIIDHPSDRSMRVLLVTIDGIQDPLVKGMQWRLGLKAERGNWKTVEAGIRRMCHRGPNTDTWTKDTCP